MESNDGIMEIINETTGTSGLDNQSEDTYGAFNLQSDNENTTNNESCVTAHESTNNLNYKKSFNKIFELTDEELFLIEENLRNKIIKNGENFIQQSDNLRITYEKFKIECEQRFIELEAEYNECQAKLTTESKNCYLYKKKADENG
jgi:hypothetical protein